jgi:hypothetical protein
VSTGLDFDPRLAALPVAFDLDAVARLVERQWRDGALPPGSVTARKLLDTKYEPGVSCVATYDLEVPVADGLGGRTIGALEVSPSRTALRTLDRDPGLPWLAHALDPRVMAPRFTSLAGSVAASPELRITAVRYKPGARCVIRYSLLASQRQRVLFGKVIAEGAEELARRIGALQEATSPSPDMPRVAGPVAYWPDLHMLVQRAVEGAELHEVAFDQRGDPAERSRWVEKAGRGLAGLHSSVVDVPTRTLSDDLDELDEYASPMRQVDAELAHRYESLVASLRAYATGRSTTSRTSHGAFRTDQFMIQDDELVLIDLDSLCLAEPERDVGNLLAYLRWKARRQPEHADFLAAAPERFLSGYASGGPAPDRIRTAVYEAASLLKIAGRRYRSLSVREWPKVPFLIETAAALIGDAERG